MKLLFFVLNHTEKLEAVLTAFALKDICGATILESEGMARMLTNTNLESEIPFLGSLRAFLSPERKNSNIILAAIKTEQLDDAIEAIESVVGDLTSKDTGVVFTMPIDFTKGMYDCGK